MAECNIEYPVGDQLGFFSTLKNRQAFKLLADRPLLSTSGRYAGMAIDVYHIR
jgi:hypothetical protein